MKQGLLADFGSTYTKLTAINLDDEEIIATAKAFTTIDDIEVGYRNALQLLEEKTENREYSIKLACSSAAGGLKMVTVGLVKQLTAKASEMAALNAGAKVQRVFAYELTKQDIKDIEALEPEIILLAGGIDGGNKKVILHNAKMIAESDIEAYILVAGNKGAVDEIDLLLTEAGKPHGITENVMPQYNELNIEPARSKIRDVFLNRIIDAKGLHKIREIMDDQVIPTPFAVLKALSCLSHGTDEEEGLGQLMGIDVGGATTDVYSIAKQETYDCKILLKGLPEPEDKRTVEGDLGLKYSVESLFEALPLETKRLFNKEILEEYFRCIEQDPSLLPQGGQQEIEKLLTTGAVREAVNRHVGYVKQQFTLQGSVPCQYGKDLRKIKKVIATGGPIVYSQKPHHILEGVCYKPLDENLLKPEACDFYVDHSYILAAMGLLSLHYPSKAIRIMKKNLKML